MCILKESNTLIPLLYFPSINNDVNYYPSKRENDVNYGSIYVQRKVCVR